MKVKIEYTDGSINIHTVLEVFVQIPDNELILVWENEGSHSEDLSGVSRVTVDNEVIYDFMGKKENFKKETAKHKIDLFIKDFEVEKIAVNVQTSDEYDDFMKFLEENSNLTWGGKKSTFLKCWYICESETCVIFRNDRNSLEYCDKKFYQSQDTELGEHKIIKFKDLMEKLNV